MKKHLVWIAVLLLGLVPFIFPFLSGLYQMSMESLSMFDWVVMYSFIHWPTYLIGMIIIPIALYQLLRCGK